MRDEGLLKLFFASASPQTAVATIEAKRRKHLETLEQFRAARGTRASRRDTRYESSATESRCRSGASRGATEPSPT